MKFIYWGLGLLLGLLAVLLGTVQLASERVEVVELHTTDEAGEALITHLWVVDDEGYQYLRVGADGSAWYRRLQANAEIQVTRDGNTSTYTTTLTTDKSDKINQLMQEKYTWGDSFMAYAVGGRDGSIPIELHLIN